MTPIRVLVVHDAAVVEAVVHVQHGSYRPGLAALVESLAIGPVRCADDLYAWADTQSEDDTVNEAAGHVARTVGHTILTVPGRVVFTGRLDPAGEPLGLSDRHVARIHRALADQ